MGAVTNQYSVEEIVEKYRKHIDSYTNIINDLNDIMETMYIKRNNIGIFLNFHLRFCVEAVDVLEDAIEAIQNDKVDESICMRLEGLFDSCAKEHKNLEDTYSRIKEKNTEEFYVYENIHIRLREECDDMEFCDATVRFVRARIRSNSNTNIFHGDAQNIQIQQEVQNSSQKAGARKEEIEDTIVEKEKTSFKEIMREKLYDVIVGGVFLGVVAILYMCQLKGLFDTLEISVSLVLLFIMPISFVFGIAFFLICIYDIANILPLLGKGSFVELESKSEWIDKIFELFRNSENRMQKEIRTTGKCYKNIDGELYKIKGKMCPFCETEPIGKMILYYSNPLKTYFWECSQNQAHQVEFDYKKKI